MKIIGYTVGTTLPKPNLAQTDPQKGDYVKGKEVLDEKYIKIDEQELTDEQKAQVRANVSAVSIEEASELTDGVAFIDAEDNENVEVPEEGGTSIDVTAQVGQTIIVKEVDANGKPTKWESADYQPRTHWEEEAVLLSGTFDAPTLQGGVAVDFALTVGNTYTVVWNGVEYSCPVRYLPSDDGVNFPALGNVDLVLEAGDTGEPFLLVYMDRILVDLSVSEYTTAELSIKGNKVNAIPQRYLANSYPYYIDVIRETFSDVQTPDMYTCSDTVENIKTIFESGRDIKIRVKSTGDNAIPYVLIYDLYLYNPFISGFLGFVSFPLSSSGFRNLLFLNPQEDGTYSVTDSIGD